MKFVIPIRRLGVHADIIEKASAGFSRGPTAGYKYTKREFVGFRNGRVIYRYYYPGDIVRERGVRQMEGTEVGDPKAVHEHELLSNIHKLFANLAKNRVKASEVTELALHTALGIDTSHVTIDPAFLRRYHAAFVQNEKLNPDEETERFPLSRVYRAFQLVPETMRGMIADRLGKIFITTRDNPKEIEKAALRGKHPPAGYTNLASGDVTLLGDGDSGHGGGSGFTAAPVGQPRFGSRFTFTEEVVWHELGHQLHEEVREKNKAAWAEWVSLGLTDKDRISAYAFTNHMEDWAESVACMISRPKQMARQCPARYDFFRKHGILPGPSREKILKVPEEEMRWWDLKPVTKASRILAAQREVDGSPSYVGAYRSDKDQFYTVHYKGRAVFFRLGPPDKDAELAGWEPVPSTIDSVTGLPVYDTTIAARFQSQQVYKEMYDENGNSLTPGQALLYLRQDDPELNDKIPEDIATWKPAERETHLGRLLFAYLGESRADQESERKRVARERAKGRTGAEDRHAWVPMEMPKSEFEALTPTFKFEEMTKAAEQPLVRRAYDRKLKRPVVVTAHNQLTGKVEPVRAATIYEVANPDGTKTKITVNETEPFVPGGTLLLPLVVTRKEAGGIESSEQQWVKYRIQPDGRLTPEEKPHEWQRRPNGSLKKVMTGTWPEMRWDALEPARLARDLGTTAEALLNRNNKTNAGQILDPMLAKLINPMHERIRCEGDLVKLMRDAAKGQNSAWVTVESGTAINPSYAHMKLTFDGGGNPLLAGEYWSRILGVDGARVDALLDEKNKVNVEGVQEIKPYKVGFHNNGPVLYKDPNTERMVYGKIQEVKYSADGGPAVLLIKPVKGQGTGLHKNVRIAEADAQQASSDINPDDIRYKLRDVKPMKNHLLLYGDSLRFAKDGSLKGGLIRLKAPADGSISEQEIRRLPAVREDDRGAFIDLRDINTLREEFGGFVMDTHVQTMLSDLARDEKRNIERAAQKDVIAVSQITSPDGGVNTDELLKGLRGTLSNGSRFKLGSHQEDFLRACARADGRIMAAHFMGTGKTIAALAAIRMMKNAKKEDGTPIDGSPRKRVCIVVPLNTAAQWHSAAAQFTEKGATLIGATTLSGAAQAQDTKGLEYGTPAGEVAARKAREEWLKENPGGWDPKKDQSAEIVIVPFEYFRDHEEDLRMNGGFDGIIVDEAHAIARENELSRAVDRWNPTMNMMLLLTGTPVTNRLNTIPRYMDLLTNGKSPFGTAKEFEDRYLTASAVMMANGAKSPPKTDLNPQRAAELASFLSAKMHIALSEDVKGKTMPAVMLDENQPAHMTGMQEKLYRLAMAAMTEQEMIKLEESGALGTDEAAAFSGGMRKKVNVARSFANSPGYKPPDNREFVTFIETVTKETKTGKPKITEVEHTFSLPDITRCTGKRPQGFAGKWPSLKDVEAGYISDSEYSVLSFYVMSILGKDYDSLAGTVIDKALLADIKKGVVNGTSWGKVPNPDYGPEGALSRGRLDENGDLQPIKAEFGEERFDVPIGTKFIRDPSKKASGLYYHQDDWDFNGKFADGGEGEDEDGKDESEEEADGTKKTGGLQQQHAKDPKMSIQLSPLRRRERAMFDASMTANNAKADELERYMLERMNTATGGDPKHQFILFGNRIGSSCRAMESKLRTLGYMDVNEALGAEKTGYSSEDDKKRRPKLGYFVTYFGQGATLGDRDINSEIFRKSKDSTGRDTDTSMFVHRTMAGSIGRPPEAGVFAEGWSRAERKSISKLFAGKDGTGGIEVPMRVTSVINGDSQSPGYVYESDLKPKDRKLVQELEAARNGAAMESKEQYEKKINAVLAQYVTSRAPLSQHQMDVFNNCKVMVASDAAQVGLNWGNASELVMYDSLHSPMQEWQRITRAARMLDAVIPDKVRPIFNKIDAHIREQEKKNGFAEYENMESAMLIVQEAYESITEAERGAMTAAGVKNAAATCEAIFANRAFAKIADARPKVSNELRQFGRTLEPVEVADPTTGEISVVQRKLKPQEITNADIMNEVLEKHLTEFDRQILKSRKYLVNVKRLTTSVNMPVFKTVKVPADDGEGFKKIRVPTGEIVPEVPSKAELSQLTQGRAKQAPYEHFMKAVQDGVPVSTAYDSLPVSGHSLASFSQLPSAPPRERAPAADGPAAPAVHAVAGTVTAEPPSTWKLKQAQAALNARAKIAARAEKQAVQRLKNIAEAEKRKAKLRGKKKTKKSFSGFFMPLSTFKGDA